MKENAKRSAEWRKKDPDGAKKAANAARMRENRRAEKMAKAQVEFQSIQIRPKALGSKNLKSSCGSEVSKGLSHKGGLPCRNDGNSSLGSDLNEDMSDYEKLRLQNIEENKRKFQELFGTSGPSLQNQKRSLSKSATNSETSDEEIAPTEKPVRRQPKRQCKSFVNEVHESFDSSFEAYVDDLVEASAAELEVDPSMIVTPIVNTIINSVFGSKTRKQNIGRKSKRAMKSSKYRQFHETDDQYQSRLKKSSALKQDNLKNEERSVRKRRLFRLKQARYV